MEDSRRHTVTISDPCKYREHSVLTIAPITPEYVAAYKATRLCALRDSPSAFGSSYATESRLTDADWLRRTHERNGDNMLMFLAFDSTEPCGIIGGYLNADHPTKATVVSMWVAPSHRQRGVGCQLMQHVIAWTRSRHATTLALHVVSNNHAAICFYKSLGFTETGHTEPYPHDPSLIEIEMALPLNSPPAP